MINSYHDFGCSSDVKCFLCREPNKKLFWEWIKETPKTSLLLGTKWKSLIWFCLWDYCFLQCLHGLSQHRKVYDRPYVLHNESQGKPCQYITYMIVLYTLSLFSSNSIYSAFTFNENWNQNQLHNIKCSALLFWVASHICPLKGIVQAKMNIYSPSFWSFFRGTQKMQTSWWG